MDCHSCILAVSLPRERTGIQIYLCTIGWCLLLPRYQVNPAQRIQSERAGQESAEIDLAGVAEPHAARGPAVQGLSGVHAVLLDPCRRVVRDGRHRVTQRRRNQTERRERHEAQPCSFVTGISMVVPPSALKAPSSRHLEGPIITLPSIAVSMLGFDSKTPAFARRGSLHAFVRPGSSPREERG